MAAARPGVGLVPGEPQQRRADRLLGERRAGARDEIQVRQRGGQLADLRGGAGVVLQDGLAQRAAGVVDRDDGGDHAGGRDGGDVGRGDGLPPSAADAAASTAGTSEARFAHHCAGSASAQPGCGEESADRLAGLRHDAGGRVGENHLGRGGADVDAEYESCHCHVRHADAERAASTNRFARSGSTGFQV